MSKIKDKWFGNDGWSIVDDTDDCNEDNDIDQDIDIHKLD